ncbi:MAG: membrane protein insertase YidC [Planctomycetota bacterium]
MQDPLAQPTKPAPLLDKTALFWLALIMLGFFGYQQFYYMPRYRAWQAEQEQKAKDEADRLKREQGEQTPGDPASVGSDTAPPPEEQPEEQDPVGPAETFSFVTPEHDMVLDSEGATLDDLTLRNVLGSTYAMVQTSEADERPRTPFHVLETWDRRRRSFALAPLTGDETDLDASQGVWHHEALESGGHRFWITLPSGVQVEKRFLPPEPWTSGDGEERPSFHFTLQVRVTNQSGETKNVGYRLNGPVGIRNDNTSGRAWGSHVLAGFKVDDDVDYTWERGHSLTDPKEPFDFEREEQAPLSFFGVGSHYFAAAVVPTSGTTFERVYGEGLLASLGREPTKDEQDDPNEVGNQAFTWAETARRELAPGASFEDEYLVYVGPRRLELFSDEQGPYYGYGLDELVDYGWVQSFSRVLLAVLFGLHAICGNWGLSIILLTFLVRGLMLPAGIWQQKNMLRMQTITPEIQKLKEKYSKADGSMTPEQQRAFSAAQMELFRKNGVNPVGCFGPILLQMPIFIGLYNALNYGFEVRDTSFMLWIQDLSQPDIIARLPFTLPLLGTNALSLLPLLMVGIYMLQQSVQPKATDERAAEQQKMMKFIMPVFALFFYTMPSGLLLYFVTSSLWTIAEMKTVKKWIQQAEEGKHTPNKSSFPGLAES